MKPITVALALLLAAPAPTRAEPISIAILSTVGFTVAAGSTAAAVATFALTTPICSSACLLRRRPQ